MPVSATAMVTQSRPFFLSLPRVDGYSACQQGPEPARAPMKRSNDGSLLRCMKSASDRYFAKIRNCPVIFRRLSYELEAAADCVCEAWYRPALHEQAPQGKVAWQFTSDGGNSVPRLAICHCMATRGTGAAAGDAGDRCSCCVRYYEASVSLVFLRGLRQWCES
jgi:hypothetical protein